MGTTTSINKCWKALQHSEHHLCKFNSHVHNPSLVIDIHVNASAKFQLHMPKILGVIALQSSNTRKIDVSGKQLQLDAQTQNLHHHVRHEISAG